MSRRHQRFVKKAGVHKATKELDEQEERMVEMAHRLRALEIELGIFKPSVLKRRSTD